MGIKWRTKDETMEEVQGKTPVLSGNSQAPSTHFGRNFQFGPCLKESGTLGQISIIIN